VLYKNFKLFTLPHTTVLGLAKTDRLTTYRVGIIVPNHAQYPLHSSLRLGRDSRCFQSRGASKHSSTIISTSRQNLPHSQESTREAVKSGAYVFRERADATVTLIGVGAEWPLQLMPPRSSKRTELTFESSVSRASVFSSSKS